MKKRLTALLLLACMLLTLMPVGTLAEGTEPTQEQQEEVISQNKEAPSGDVTPAPAADPAPVDPCANGHSFGDAWINLGNGTHAHKCGSCQATSDPVTCTYAEATCTAPKTCSACGSTEGQPLPHNWGDWTSNGNGTHSHQCQSCSASETADCSGGTASCTELAACEVCGGKYGEHTHYSLVCKYIDGTNTHGYYCTNPICPYAENPLRTENCGYTDATCTSPAKCGKCFHQEGAVNPANHVGETEAVRNAGTEMHNVVCKSCGKAVETNVPCTSDGKADCSNKAKCTVCKGDMGSLGSHVIKDSPATCLKAAKCDVCKQDVGNAPGHDRTGDGPCRRANCDCPHTDLWKDSDPSAASAKCAACGKIFEKKPLNVNFTVTGFGIGKPISGLAASCDDPNVTNVTATAATVRAATFQADTKYTITVTYTTAPGYRVSSAKINGTAVTPGSGSAAIDMGQPKTLYKISYKGVDSTAGLPTEYTSASLPITLPDVSKTGYTFNGWTGNGTTTPKKGLTIPVGTAKNLTFTASFTANKMTVTFDMNGHGKNVTQTVDYGRKCPTPKTPTDKNVIFVYWLLNGSKYDFSTPVTQNITLLATWQDAGYIAFNNTSFGTVAHNVERGVQLKNYGKPAMSGYYFCGWYADSNFQTPISTVNVEKGKTVSVYAKWKKMDTTNPKTGDTRHPELAAAVLTLSAASLGAVTILHKKKRSF